MPRYYFDISDGVEIRDEIGRELKDKAALRKEAPRVAVQLMSAEADDAKETALVLTVRDDADTIPMVIRLVCQIEER